MKNIAKLLTSMVVISLFVLTPSVAFAQDVPVVEVGPSEDDTSIPTTPTDTTVTDPVAGVPATGIAPPQSKFAQNATVFLVGGAAGAAIGYGIIRVKKSSQQLK